MVNDNRRLTAYCGLYCKDCIPSNKELFSLVEDLDNLLVDLKFDKYAEFKSTRSEIFLKYDDFVKVLKEIKKLKCDPQCYIGPSSELGCSKSCAIRECAFNKMLKGCWECSIYHSCDKLINHKKFHPGVEKNLDTIKECGIDEWISKRGKHYNW